MFQNYLKVTLRNLLNHKVFSFLNIFGLALSMSVCLFVILLVKDAHSYDLFHPQGDRVYRILTDADRKEGRDESYASSPFIVGKTLHEDFSHLEIWTPLVRRFSGDLRSEGKTHDFRGLYSDSGFFDMFGFELALGDPADALTEPYSIVLTDELAKRIFNEENPIGKILEAPGCSNPLKVTGVLKPFPGKTHLEFTALGSLSTLLAEEKLPGHSPVTTDWRDYYMTYNFVRLKPGADKSAAELALADIAKTNYAGLELESRDAGYGFRLQSLDDITPMGMLSNTMGSGMPVFLVWFFTALGAIIMLSACFNYTNLTVARALIRTKEVGVRKVLGASRGQVFGQFMGEAVVTSLLALVLGYHLMKVLKPQFMRLNFTQFLDLRLEEDAMLFVWFFAFAALVGVVAGVLPALTLSKTSPLAILQKLQNVKFIQRVGLRKALLVVQFTVTLFFFLLLSVVWRQVDHAIVTNFGFDQPHTMVIDLQLQPFDKAEAALGQVAGVEKTSGISRLMGTWQDGSADVRMTAEAERRGVRDYHIDHNYLDHFGIKLVAGENFPANPSQQQELFVIVNQTFVKDFQLGEPNEAIGKPLLLNDSTQVTIRGVVADFPFKPAIYQMEPLLLRYAPAELGYLNIELSGTDPAAAVTALERAWKKLETGRDFRGRFFDEEVRENYANMMDISYIIAFFGVMGMVIACMGLLGMAIYTVETKSKEVSIRKVLGASARDVVLQLSKGYLWLLVIAVLIAVPLSYFASSFMLAQFAERISLNVWIFLPGVLFLLVVAGLTVGSQTVRAGLSNPVEALKNE